MQYILFYFNQSVAMIINRLVLEHNLPIRNKRADCLDPVHLRISPPIQISVENQVSAVALGIKTLLKIANDILPIRHQVMVA